jgi:nicotinamidase-related amidase
VAKGAQIATDHIRRKHSHALLIIDMISDFAFPGGSRLIGPALRIATNIARLKQRAKRKHVPCIYVNDSLGHWNSDRAELINRCLALNTQASALVRLIEPSHDDYFIIKPRHSGFFATPLHLLLTQLQACTLIITGVTTHQCVLFSAVDAYMRGFRLVIPQDCVGAISPAHTRTALALFKISLDAKTSPSREITFAGGGRASGRAPAM